jgi:hypothetical protein
MIAGLLLRLYESLTFSDRPAPADLIFVMAGKMERKDYGLVLYRAGLSPRLVLGVGRFEVSKMYRVALDHAVVEELIALRDKTPADQRHFFVKLEAFGVSIEKRLPRRWSTYGEILDLRDWLKATNVRRVMVISTDIHLSRVAVTFDKVFRGCPIEFCYCPVPASDSSLVKREWWSRPGDRRYVISETVKLAAYRFILLMPQFLIRRFMRLKD